ncbi:MULTISPECIES: hypothetical protein [Trichocoleus]|uniref:Uncharacterized protein n=1 Tax=Trichocoleus desertorum GB2-A4 TaxID=2933944 RepID=A0ABV0JCJ5_9CYAN|nr:hypothetical protein [Trichocoleus sp. FACHB-46]MBD1864156.1 hypothetical protein [Trichocoleus sp. FACHB-46]
MKPEKLSGRYPFPDIVQRVQSLDRRRGWPIRTEAALESQFNYPVASGRGLTEPIRLTQVLNSPLSR